MSEIHVPCDDMFRLGNTDMGQNPVWDEDGSNVFHFVFKDRSGFITLELFNRNNESIGVSR
jgi:hypothetical protein